MPGLAEKARWKVLMVAVMAELNGYHGSCNFDIRLLYDVVLTPDAIHIVWRDHRLEKVIKTF